MYDKRMFGLAFIGRLGVYALACGLEIVYYSARNLFISSEHSVRKILISSDASSLLLDNYESDSDMLEDQSDLD